LSKKENKRRDFLKSIMGFGALSVVSGVGIYMAPKLKSDSLLLRPPGAVDEEDFLKLCIKCGQCLQVCPYDSILLEDIDGGASLGMAYIDPHKRGCYLCEAFPCILACPTGALDHEHDNIKYVHMGIAVLKDENGCIALKNEKVPGSAIDKIYDHTKILSKEERESKKVVFNGNESEKEELQKRVLEKLENFREKSCTICADMCPFIPDPKLAIGMVKKGEGMIPQIREACVGCGVCVELCPTQVLEIIPRKGYKDIYERGDRDV
jgi:ferredoxin-type protein NapG